VNFTFLESRTQVVFEKSRDGVAWEPVGEQLGVYTGGVCEVTFTFTAGGDLVATHPSPPKLPPGPTESILYL
jgi:hypothetical protein